jgi:MSHA biogenesis protein MshQ
MRRQKPARTRRAACVGGLGLTALLAFGCGGSDGPTTPVTPSPTTLPTVSNAGLVLLLHMDEPLWTGAADEVVDSSGGKHHGTATPGATTVAAGKFGRGAVLGRATGVRIADAPALRPISELTVAAWIQPNGLGRGNWLGIVAKRVDYQVHSAYTFHITNEDRLGADVDAEDNRFAVGPPLVNGLWYHVALVFDGRLPAASRVAIYVDGVLVGTGSESASAIRPFDSPLWVGCLPLTAAAQSFAGVLDEVAVWHRALTPPEISALALATGPIAN